MALRGFPYSRLARSRALGHFMPRRVRGRNGTRPSSDVADAKRDRQFAMTWTVPPAMTAAGPYCDCCLLWRCAHALTSKTCGMTQKQHPRANCQDRQESSVGVVHRRFSAGTRMPPCTWSLRFLIGALSVLTVPSVTSTDSGCAPPTMLPLLTPPRQTDEKVKIYHSPSQAMSPYTPSAPTHHALICAS